MFVALPSAQHAVGLPPPAGRGRHRLHPRVRRAAAGRGPPGRPAGRPAHPAGGRDLLRAGLGRRRGVGRRRDAAGGPGRAGRGGRVARSSQSLLGPSRRRRGAPGRSAVHRHPHRRGRPRAGPRRRPHHHPRLALGLYVTWPVPGRLIGGRRGALGRRAAGRSTCGAARPRPGWPPSSTARGGGSPAGDRVGRLARRRRCRLVAFAIRQVGHARLLPLRVVADRTGAGRCWRDRQQPGTSLLPLTSSSRRSWAIPCGPASP